MSHPVTFSDSERNLKQTSQTHLFIQEKHNPWHLFIAGSGDHESWPLILFCFSFIGGSWTKGIRQKQWPKLDIFHPFFSRSKFGAVGHPKKNRPFRRGRGWHCNGCKKRNGDNWHGRVRRVPGFFRFFPCWKLMAGVYTQKNGWARLGTGGCSGFEIWPFLVSMLDFWGVTTLFFINLSRYLSNSGFFK